jgi:hypothetical protein
MTVDLGQLKKMRAAELWKHEEHDFTPWLATEENIGRLAEAPHAALQSVSLFRGERSDN